MSLNSKVIILYSLQVGMPTLYRISVTQHDCPHSKISLALPDLKIFIMNTQTEGHFQNVLTFFHSSKTGTMDKALRALNQFKGLKGLSIIGKRENSMSLLYSFPQTALSRDIQGVGFRLHPVMVKNGVERWFLLAYNSRDENSYKPVGNQNTKLVSAKKLTTEEFVVSYSKVLSEISRIRVFVPRSVEEENIAEKAYRLGYFEWPRRISISKLSREANIPKSTFVYKLRKAEKGILDDLWQDDSSAV